MEAGFKPSTSSGGSYAGWLVAGSKIHFCFVKDDPIHVTNDVGWKLDSIY